MRLFGKRQEERLSYDRSAQYPVVRSSICTGEKVCGFKDRESGRFTEYGTIRSDADLQSFMDKYGISKEEIKLEW